MALSENHLLWRTKGIGGSDAITIARGTADDWKSLKAEKIDGVRPVFTIQQRLLMDMGTAIEPVALHYLHSNVTALGGRNLRVLMPEDDLFRCTLDASTVAGLPVQVKFHTGDKDIDDLTEFYWPQLQHEMLVTRAKVLIFAVVFGHWGRFAHAEVGADHEYQSEYMLRALQFKEYCWGGGELPAGMEEAATPLGQNVPRLRDHVWNTGDNQIAPLATAWLDNRPMAEAYKEAETNLKKLVPEDARSATWVAPNKSGIKITVNKAGSKSIKPHVGR